MGCSPKETVENKIFLPEDIPDFVQESHFTRLIGIEKQLNSAIKE
jgi:hypothetical protein